MLYSYKIDNDKKLMSVIGEGILSHDAALKATLEYHDIVVRKNITRLLADYSTMSIKMNKEEIIDLAKAIAEKTPLDKSIKRAIVSNCIHGTLYETMNQEHGFHARVFQTKETAIEWLLSEE